MRQAVVVLLAILILVVGVAGLLPRTWVTAQEGETPPTPTIRSSRQCAPPGQRAAWNVAGSGFPRGSTVRVTFMPYGDLLFDATNIEFASLVSPASLVAPRSAGEVSRGDDVGIVVVEPEAEPEAMSSVDVQVDDLGTFRAGVDDIFFPLGYEHRVTARVTDEGGDRAAITIRDCGDVDVVATPRCSNGRATSIGVQVSGEGVEIDHYPEIWVCGENRAHCIVEGALYYDPGSNLSNAAGGISTEIPVDRLPAGIYQVWYYDAWGRFDRGWRGMDWVDTSCSPPPTLSASPKCEPAGSPPSRMPVHVTGTGFHPDRRIEIVFDPDRSYELWRVRADAQGNFDALIYPYRRSNGVYNVRARSPGELGGLAPPMRVARDSIEVPCPRPVTPPPDGDEVTPPDGDEVSPPPPPPTVPPRPKATLTTDPSCVRPAIQGDEPRLISLRVQGTGWDPGPVTIDYDAPGKLPGRSVTRKADRSGRIDDTVRIRPPASGTAGITARQTVAKVGSIIARGRTQQISAKARVTAPCRKREPPPLTIRPECGIPAEGIPDAYAITVIGKDFYRGSDVSIGYGAADRREWFSARPETSGRVKATIVVDGRRDELVPIVAEQLDTRGLAVARSSARFTVPCPIDPTITIEPEQGPPGYTALVKGDDFWPGTTVTLRWDTGIDAGHEYQVQVEADGTFETYLLIMHHDWPGKRNLRAGMPGEPDVFPDAEDDYLVVPDSGQPAGEPGDQVIDRR